ncbi:phosphohistidine phosphatase [Arenicella chitinivorans]|uniref:Phosphohistidine phosphatase n=1 Tax=Arenicella chitinivorans TaxID=1329800 RepID=A0A918VLH4_9GAMM|nr:histidine phosphatase family protein [Arenicella chitinivorans]GHA08125.1 phosphohistidine phosphatase [Arenicella chitinivorans]
MKTLQLIRHAKSSWDNPNLSDHDRPLNARGERDTNRMAEFFTSLSDRPDAIYTSTATRAISLAAALSDASGLRLMPEPSLYTFDSAALLGVLQCLPDATQCIAVVGHNPAITELVNRLANESLTNVPTSGIVQLACDLESWAELCTGCAELVQFTAPKMLN